MDKIIRTIKALADTTRLRMLNLLIQRECCVCEVMQILKISQTRASRNLSMLHQAGFLRMRREGLWVYYSLNNNPKEFYLNELIKSMDMAMKSDKIARKDILSLNKTKRLGPSCCCPEIRACKELK